MQFTIELSEKEVTALREILGIDNPESYYRTIVTNTSRDAIEQYNRKILSSIPLEDATNLIEGYKNLSEEDKTKINNIIQGN